MRSFFFACTECPFSFSFSFFQLRPIPLGFLVSPPPRLFYFFSAGRGLTEVLLPFFLSFSFVPCQISQTRARYRVCLSFDWNCVEFDRTPFSCFPFLSPSFPAIFYSRRSQTVFDGESSFFFLLLLARLCRLFPAKGPFFFFPSLSYTVFPLSEGVFPSRMVDRLFFAPFSFSSFFLAPTFLTPPSCGEKTQDCASD